MRSFSNSLAVNPAHVHVEEVNTSTQNKSIRNMNALKFCLVLASLGKFNIVNCSSFTPPKKHCIGAISNKVLAVSREQSAAVSEQSGGGGRHSTVCTG